MKNLGPFAEFKPRVRLVSLDFEGARRQLWAVLLSHRKLGALL